MFKRISTIALGVISALSISASAQAAAPNYPVKPMEFIAPAGAGGGWDTTIRMVAKALQDEGIVKVAMPVENRPGGGGGIALAYIQAQKGSDRLITVYSPPLIYIKLNGTSKFGYKDLTPIARLISDFGAFYVGKNSKYKTMTEVLEALKKDPSSVKIGGTSAAGSMDHLQFLEVAKAYGIKDVKKIQYISFQDNSGTTQLMGGFIDVFSGGVGELRGLVDSGDIKVLATTAPERFGTGNVRNYPTCKEQKINVVFYNWRGLFGPPNMPEHAVKFWRDALGKMAKSPTWAKLMEQNQWSPAYQDQPEFLKFLEKADANARVTFQELGILAK